MGRSKPNLRLAGRTLLERIKGEAERLGFPMRIIRQDLRPGLGPVGGIQTALRSTRERAVLFLACDMPFVSAPFLRALVRNYREREGMRSLFTRSDDGAGFPFILSVEAKSLVDQQLEDGKLSLQSLARRIGASFWEPRESWRDALFNVNTPADWKQAQERAKKD